MTNNQQQTDHGAHHHCPPMVLPDLQTKAVVMEAEVEAVTVGNGNTGGSGSGGAKDNDGNSDGRGTDKNN
jgi:hypothetical protein